MLNRPSWRDSNNGAGEIGETVEETLVPETVPEYEFAGVPDAFQRLWTPHRMVYIGGAGKPASDAEQHCPFCDVSPGSDRDRLIVARGEWVYAVLNLYPYNPGHLMVVPYRHFADYTELSTAEAAELGRFTQLAMRTLRAVAKPPGFNLGVNQGAVGGAGIAAHLHQHVVPRWNGDMNFMPVIGRTRVLPQLLADTRDLLAAAWPGQAAENQGDGENQQDGEKRDTES
jgi:ATP adenylyltransferase